MSIAGSVTSEWSRESIGTAASVTSSCAFQSTIADDENSINPMMNCTLKGDVDGVERIFENSVNQGINWTKERSYYGKTALEMAVILGRVKTLGIFLKHNIDMRKTTKAGYTLAHTAAAWGQVDSLRFLADCEINWKLKTRHGETPQMVAARYQKEESEIFIRKALAKLALIECVGRVTEAVETANSKLGIKLEKADKVAMANFCNETLEWANSCLNAPEKDQEEITQSDIEEKQKELEAHLQAIFDKTTTVMKKNSIKKKVKK